VAAIIMRAVAEWDAQIDVDEALARELISARFAQLDDGALRRVGEGWDNVVWATADGVAFRFPRREIAVAGVKREIGLLPLLAPRLPLAIPDAAYPGAPGERFPWPWFGSRLIEGREIAAAGLDDDARSALAPALGRFLRALHAIDLDAVGAAALPVDPNRRTDMAARVPRTRAALAAAAAARLWRAPPHVAALLDRAARLPAPESTVLAHGDLHVRHLLVGERGELSGVIDWGDVCRAHRAADLSLYWSLLAPAGRDALLDSYGPVGDDGLLRARVLALCLNAQLAAYAHDRGMHELRDEAVAGLQRTATR
jgi:aminoglycoside phosphotransferase (APT) family kinase protein